MSQKLSTTTQLAPTGKVSFALSGYPEVTRNGFRLQRHAHLRRRGHCEADYFLQAGGRGALRHARWGRVQLERDAVGVRVGAAGGGT